MEGLFAACYVREMSSLSRLRLRRRQGLPDQPRVRQDSRVYAIGDLHGRLDLMITMLQSIAEDHLAQGDTRRCKIIFLGDYIDRGDYSRSVLDVLMRLTEDTSDGVVALRGNHEDALLNFLKSPVQMSSWLHFGAQQTLANYGLPAPSRAPSESDLIDLRDALQTAMGDHVGFLRGLPSFTVMGNVIFSHAGLDPDDAEALKNEHAMIWGHPEAQNDWPAPGRLLVHGHFDAPHPVERPGRICVDTGAYYSGRLTAVRLDDATSFITVE